MTTALGVFLALLLINNKLKRLHKVCDCIKHVKEVRRASRNSYTYEYITSYTIRRNFYNNNNIIITPRLDITWLFSSYETASLVRDKFRLSSGDNLMH